MALLSVHLTCTVICHHVKVGSIFVKLVYATLLIVIKRCLLLLIIEEQRETALVLMEIQPVCQGSNRRYTNWLSLSLCTIDISLISCKVLPTFLYQLNYGMVQLVLIFLVTVILDDVNSTFLYFVWI